MNEKITHIRGLVALSPLLVFVIFYLVFSIVVNDFYQIPITLAFLVSCVYAFLTTKRENIITGIETFCENAGRSDVLMMILIFILAGVFASTAKAMGSIQSIVDITLMLMPSNTLLMGLFMAACFVSLSIGTSVGTIVALVPIAKGLSEQTDYALPLLVAVVVGGSFFGDNLSFISDTTIMATKSLGCRLKDKFIANLRIVLPAALLTIILYSAIGTHSHTVTTDGNPNLILVIPYIFVLIAAICGMNVILVLIVGILLSGLIGSITGNLSLFPWFDAMNAGIMGMSELIIVTLLASGLMGIIRQRGGIDYLIQNITKNIHNVRGAELSIATLVVLVDMCTANNTIAIMTVGPLAKEISHTYGITARRCASLIDTFACTAQGLLPYGAQLLIASGLSLINPLEIIPYLYYPFILGIVSIIYILIQKSHESN